MAAQTRRGMPSIGRQGAAVPRPPRCRLVAVDLDGVVWLGGVSPARRGGRP